eukprot:792526-Rhodomonas_salina.3
MRCACRDIGGLTRQNERNDHLTSAHALSALDIAQRMRWKRVELTWPDWTCARKCRRHSLHLAYSSSTQT